MKNQSVRKSVMLLIVAALALLTLTGCQIVQSPPSSPGQPQPGQPQPGQPPMPGQPEQPQPGLPQPGQPQPGQPQPGQPPMPGQPEQPQPGLPQPGQPQPAQPQPGQPPMPGQPEQPQPGLPQPGQPQPVQPQPVQPQPVQPQPGQSSSSAPSSGSGCAAPVIPYFKANPASITAGQSSTLSWGDVYYGNTKTWAQSTVINPDLGEVGSGASSRTVKPTKTTTYTMISTGCGGTDTKQVTVTVSDSPIPVVPIQIDFQATDLYLDEGKFLHIGVKNNSTQSGNMTFGVSCKGDFHVTKTGSKTGVTYSASSLTYAFNANQERWTNTNIKLDKGVGFYDLTCTINSMVDTNSSNNSVTRTVQINP